MPGYFESKYFIGPSNDNNSNDNNSNNISNIVLKSTNLTHNYTNDCSSFKNNLDFIFLFKNMPFQLGDLIFICDSLNPRCNEELLGQFIGIKIDNSDSNNDIVFYGLNI